MSNLQQLAPEQWCLEDDPFLLGFGNFSGANLTTSYSKQIDF